MTVIARRAGLVGLKCLIAIMKRMESFERKSKRAGIDRTLHQSEFIFNSLRSFEDFLEPRRIVAGSERHDGFLVISGFSGASASGALGLAFDDQRVHVG